MYHKPVIVSVAGLGWLAWLTFGWAVLVVITLIALAVILSRLLPRSRPYRHRRDEWARHERWNERDEHGRFRRRGRDS